MKIPACPIVKARISQFAEAAGQPAGFRLVAVYFRIVKISGQFPVRNSDNPFYSAQPEKQLIPPACRVATYGRKINDGCDSRPANSPIEFDEFEDIARSNGIIQGLVYKT